MKHSHEEKQIDKIFTNAGNTELWIACFHHVGLQFWVVCKRLNDLNYSCKHLTLDCDCEIFEYGGSKLWCAGG